MADGLVARARACARGRVRACLFVRVCARTRVGTASVSRRAGVACARATGSPTYLSTAIERLRSRSVTVGSESLKYPLTKLTCPPVRPL